MHSQCERRAKSRLEEVGLEDVASCSCSRQLSEPNEEGLGVSLRFSEEDGGDDLKVWQVVVSPPKSLSLRRRDNFALLGCRHSDSRASNLISGGSFAQLIGRRILHASYAKVYRAMKNILAGME